MFAFFLTNLARFSEHHLVQNQSGEGLTLFSPRLRVNYSRDHFAKLLSPYYSPKCSCKFNVLFQAIDHLTGDT
jgi:hypothetical protein